MPLLEVAKRAFEALTGHARPTVSEALSLVRTRKPYVLRFKDDGSIPNNPRLPLIYYRSPVALAAAVDPAAVFEVLFGHHGWLDQWRDAIYDFQHFHTQTHEVLGIARGTARAQFGGPNGRVIALKAGDVVVLPAGTGHRRLSKSKDLVVVGAYPPGGTYDEPKPGEVDHDSARRSIKKTKIPATDPVYGKHGPLCRLWRKDS